jgi:hypothetical protein
MAGPSRVRGPHIYHTKFRCQLAVPYTHTSDSDGSLLDQNLILVLIILGERALATEFRNRVQDPYHLAQDG